MANYMLIGGMPWNGDFSGAGWRDDLNFDKATVRQLWDAYYVPFVRDIFGFGTFSQ